MILYKIVPSYYFGGYPFIPIYFYLIGAFSVCIFDFFRRFAPQKMLLLYMAMRAGKMILSVFVAIICCMIMREDVKVFLLTFIVFYLLYLIYETWFYSYFEMNLKRKK